METSNARDTIVKAKELIAQLNPLEERHIKGIQAKELLMKDLFLICLD